MDPTLSAPRGSLPLMRWPGPAPAVLALHGFTGRGADFASVAPALGRAVLAPDLPGHGDRHPDPTAGCTMADAVARLVPMLAEAPVVLGYSMGGRTALSLAAAHPESVKALVLIGATPGIEGPAERAARQAVDESRARRVESIGVEAFLDEWARVPIIATQDRIAPAVKQAMRQGRRGHRVAGLAASLRGMGTGAMPALWHRLGAVRRPTLIVTGAEDPKFTAIGRRMLSALPQATHVIIPGAGHCPHLEAPGETLPVIANWLRGFRTGSA